MEIEDKSGQPRSSEELEEALEQVEKTMVASITKVPPNLAVYIGVIREALIELIAIRKTQEKTKRGAGLDNL